MLGTGAGQEMEGPEARDRASGGMYVTRADGAPPDRGPEPP
jgi:hypothetical protein